MVREYVPAEIEGRWQAHWERERTFRAHNPGEPGFDAGRPKFYVLDMFPYPSGSGLHVGHPEGYTATDIIARHKRMRGFNVLHPMGWDAFGLPAEQHAVETGTHPAETTRKNIDTFRRQLKMLGFSYDWDRELSTTDESYYRWTQWIFLQMFNSWYDGSADKARPISELEKLLEAERLVVRFDGAVVPPGPAGLQQVAGIPIGTRFWHELSPAERRGVLDHHRLAYLAEVPVNWCPALGTVLANEEVTNEGRSERGNHPVYRRPMRQWMLRITAYADRLERDLEHLAWPESVKQMQRNWIGRSEGAIVQFQLDQCRDREGAGDADGESIEIFTTRPDTLFGATYMVLAPEHPLVERITTAQHRAAVADYCAAARNRPELERTAETKKKTGVFTGASAINPVNQERIPIWVADYVLMGYGTGAIMAVPAHDERDFDFARQFGLPIRVVVAPGGEAVEASKRSNDETDLTEAFVGDGTAVNSGEFDGLATAEFKKRIVAWLEERRLGRGTVNYKLRDWLFSRQRYWGEPFPILHGPDGEIIALDESELPLKLPPMDDFRPTVTRDYAPGRVDAAVGAFIRGGPDDQSIPEPPLGRAKDWATVVRDGKTYRRELNTMPQWAGSCWYYLRFIDPKNESRFCGQDAERYWMTSKKRDGTAHVGGIDLYLGGAEHAVLHLLYARFWHKVLFDLGHVSTPEPFGKLFNQGMIRAFAYTDARGAYVGYDDIDFREDGGYHRATGERLRGAVEKMSKSMKNVINPEEVVHEYGADSLRLYEMFMGPLDASKPWNPRDVPGVFRFLQRTWRMLVDEATGGPSNWVNDGAAPAGPNDADPIEKALHKTIRKVTEDIEKMAFNTAISAMMEFVNEVYRAKRITVDQARRFVLVLSPFAPHLAEELWQRLHGEAWRGSLAYEPWPAYDERLTVEEEVEIPVQVNGKVVARIVVSRTADEAMVRAAAMGTVKVAERIGNEAIQKVVYVPGRMLNLVVK